MQRKTVENLAVAFGVGFKIGRAWRRHRRLKKLEKQWLRKFDY